ncbi:MAG: SH3 domain-containing protein [Oscillochloridaceae bacterium]|nr:SH3 domain-containing protein [Chloroflexaceae bacterium]MDW8391918.1 SH3 domain-containing protein [Oscillochloridaceae bacterium]
MNSAPAGATGQTPAGGAYSASPQATRRLSSTTSRQRAPRGGRGGSSREQIDALIHALGDTSHPLHTVAVDELAAIGAPAIPALGAAMAPNQPWLTIYRAAEAAGRIGDARAVGPLVQALNHPNSNVRWSAVRALSQIGDVRALWELRRVAQTDQGRTSWGEPVADTARSALDEIRRRSVWGQGLELIKTAVVAVLMIFSLVLAFSVVSALRDELAGFGRIIPGQTQIPQLTLPTVAPTSISAAPTAAPVQAPVGAAPTVEPILAPTTASIATDVLTGTVRQDANVRPFPGTNNQPIGRVTFGDEIIFIGRSPNSQWYLIRLGSRHSPGSAINSPDGAGWVNQALVSPPLGDVPVREPEATPMPTASP